MSESEPIHQKKIRRGKKDVIRAKRSVGMPPRWRQDATLKGPTKIVDQAADAKQQKNKNITWYTFPCGLPLPHELGVSYLRYNAFGNSQRRRRIRRRACTPLVAESKCGSPGENERRSWYDFVRCCIELCATRAARAQVKVLLARPH